MKTFVIAIFGLAIGTALLHAQGIISFWGLAAGIQTNTSSYYAQDIGSYVTGKTFGSSLAPDAYNYIVLAAISTNAADEENPLGADWNAVTYEGGPIAVATNYIAAGSVTGLGTATGFATDLNPDTLYYIMAVGWSSNLGDWTQIQGDIADGFEGSPAGYFGVSVISTIETSESPNPGEPVFMNPEIPQNTMVLYAVPEPTTLALAGLGGLSIIFLRRRS